MSSTPPEPSDVEALEDLLRSASVKGPGPPYQEGVTGLTASLELEGSAPPVFAKFESEEHGDVYLRRERAAWVIARKLGWTDLVPCTVLRDLELPDGSGETAMASVQVFSDGEPDVAASWPDHDQRRAAVFDYLIENSDRWEHNWVTWRDEDGTPRLRLIDHSFSFGEPPNRQGPISTFYTRCRNELVPDEVLRDVERLRGALDDPELESLLGSEHVAELRERIERLFTRGRLP